MAEYDYVTDVAVVGSGGGGLVSALVRWLACVEETLERSIADGQLSIPIL